MHDKLFEANRKLEGEDLRRYAQEAGLDLPRFERETAEHAHAGRVREGTESALASEVQETPTFFITVSVTTARRTWRRCWRRWKATQANPPVRVSGRLV